MECRFRLIYLNKQSLSGLMARLCKPCHKRQDWRRMADIARKNRIWEMERIRRDFCKIPPYSNVWGKWRSICAGYWLCKSVCESHCTSIHGICSVGSAGSVCTSNTDKIFSEFISSLFARCLRGFRPILANLSVGRSIEPMLRATRPT